MRAFRRRCGHAEKLGQGTHERDGCAHCTRCRRAPWTPLRTTSGCRSPARSRVQVEPLSWTPALAYAVGLSATDGCLINTGRHVAFVSSDRDLVESFLACIGRRSSHFRKDGNVYRAQLGDVELYRWLSGTGLTQRKSLT